MRYYERIGLLAARQRSESGYRLYDEKDVERLQFIRGAQQFGLRLAAIAELVDLRDRGMCPCGHTNELLEARLAEIDGDIESLSRQRDDIRRIIRPEPAASSKSGACQPDFIQIQRRRSSPSSEVADHHGEQG